MRAKELQPGRKLDALVAEHVMGFRREKAPPDANGENGGTDILVPSYVDHQFWHYPPLGGIALTFFVPKYSTDLKEAWPLVEKHFFNVIPYRNDSGKTSWMVSTCHDLNRPDAQWVISRTAPEAICKLALIVVGWGKE